MSLSGLNQLPIEYISLDNTIPLAVLLLSLCVQALHIIFNWDAKVYSFFLGSDRSSIPEKQTSRQLKSFATAEREKKSREDSGSSTLPEKEIKSDDRLLCKGDVEVVLRSLGMLSQREQTIRFQENDVFDLFEEMEEPSEYEVRAVFKVFDENKDGFIDARELQRITGALGLTEGSDMENCKKMIRAADENGDDKIDFSEFVKFMETIWY